jgi:hypothetical protein
LPAAAADGAQEPRGPVAHQRDDGGGPGGSSSVFKERVGGGRLHGLAGRTTSTRKAGGVCVVSETKSATARTWSILITRLFAFSALAPSPATASGTVTFLLGGRLGHDLAEVRMIALGNQWHEEHPPHARPDRGASQSAPRGERASELGLAGSEGHG